MLCNGPDKFRTCVGLRRRFYRPPPLTTRTPTRTGKATLCAVHYTPASKNFLALWLQVCDFCKLLFQRAEFLKKERKPETGLEPATRCLQNSRSTTELLRQGVQNNTASIYDLSSGAAAPTAIFRVGSTKKSPAEKFLPMLYAVSKAWYNGCDAGNSPGGLSFSLPVRRPRPCRSGFLGDLFLISFSDAAVPVTSE